ncbi:MAG: T9SS type A sorting domain-containing protein [Flavobacteriales bacterium]
MKKVLFIIILIGLFVNNTKATHVFGGDMSFTQIGANQFILKFRMAHDNLSLGWDSTGVTIFENTSNSLITVVNLKRDSTNKLILRNGIIKIDSIYISFFSDTLTLSSNPNGYYTSWSHCCRISSLINIVPSTMTLTCQIPNPIITGGNSNPEFVQYPDSLYMCIGMPKTLDFSCIDPDGDSLVYSLKTPHNIASSGGRKPFFPVGWNAAFNVSNYIGPGASISINPSTGIITANAAQLGRYQIAVLCEEYRNGVKIGETYRDIPVPAVNCSILSTDNYISSTAINIFPNPSNGNFTLFIEDYNHSNFNLNVIDVTGKLVYNQQINSPQTFINLEKLNRGIYFIQLNDGVNRTSKRIVIQ